MTEAFVLADQRPAPQPDWIAAYLEYHDND